MKDIELRGIILNEFYEKRRGQKFVPQSEDFFPPIPKEDIYAICKQLKDSSLITIAILISKGLGTYGIITDIVSGQITTLGIDIIENSELTDSDKQEAYVETQIIAEATSQPDEQQKGSVRKALRYFRGLSSELEAIPEVVTKLGKIITAISNFFEI